MLGVPDEARLARAAAAGDGQAFARLYDGYEQRIYTFCLRLVGNDQDAQDATQDAFLKVLQRLPKLQDRELNFGAYLFTAARNASYDVIGKRKKADAVDEIPESGARPVYGDGAPLEVDPERAAMLGSVQESVRAANGQLPERQREVLALREVEELSYDEIAVIMDMNRNSVAQLISRARIKLRDELRGSALASVAASSAECERALPLISMRQDGQLSDDDDRSWLTDHIEGCATCQVSVDAMEEAGLSYRAWTPVVPAAFLFRDTMAKAAELTGSDWSDVGRPGEDDAGRGDAGRGDAGGAGATPGAAAPGSATAATAAMAAIGTQTEPDADERRRRGLFAGVLAAVLLLLGGGVALVVGSDDPPRRASETPVTTPATPVVVTGADGTRTVVQPQDREDRERTSRTDGRTSTTDVPGTTTTAPTRTTGPTEQRKRTRTTSRQEASRDRDVTPTPVSPQDGSTRPPVTDTPAPSPGPPTVVTPEPPTRTEPPPPTTTEPPATTEPPTTTPPTTTPPPACTSPTQTGCTVTPEYCRSFPRDPRCATPPRTGRIAAAPGPSTTSTSSLVR